MEEQLDFGFDAPSQINTLQSGQSVYALDTDGELMIELNINDRSLKD